MLRFSGYFECMLELWNSGKLSLREKNLICTLFKGQSLIVYDFNMLLCVLLRYVVFAQLCSALRSHVLQFLINCFQSLEQEFVRECCLRREFELKSLKSLKPFESFTVSICISFSSLKCSTAFQINFWKDLISRLKVRPRHFEMQEFNVFHC